MLLDELEWQLSKWDGWDRAEIPGGAVIYRPTAGWAGSRKCRPGEYALRQPGKADNDASAFHMNLDPLTAQALLFHYLGG